MAVPGINPQDFALQTIAADDDVFPFIKDPTGTPIDSKIVPEKLLSSRGALAFQGDWNATTNVPDLTLAAAKIKGHFYRVSVDGSTNLDGITRWQIVDWAWYDGTVWHIQRSGDTTENFWDRSGIDLTPENAGDNVNIKAAKIKYGVGTDVTQVLLEYDSGIATLPVLQYNPAIGGFGGNPGLKWSAQGAGIDAGFQIHAEGGASQFFVTSGNAIETQSFWIGYAPGGSIASGKLWLTQYDSTTDDLIIKSNNLTVITSRWSIDFATGVISANTVNYKDLVTSDEHITNKGYVDSVLPVEVSFSEIATAAQTIFNLPSTPPSAALVKVFRNGILATITTNYTISGSVLTWVSPTLVAGEEIKASYNDTGLTILVNIINKSASVTAALSDAQTVLEYTNGVSDFNYTLPQNSDVAFPIGSWIEIRKTGTGEITLLKGTGTTFRGALGDVSAKIDGADGFSAFIEKTASNTWLLSGSVKAV